MVSCFFVCVPYYTDVVTEDGLKLLREKVIPQSAKCLADFDSQDSDLKMWVVAGLSEVIRYGKSPVGSYWPVGLITCFDNCKQRRFTMRYARQISQPLQND